jgi:uncharacterized protein (TIGR02646 family)
MIRIDTRRFPLSDSTREWLKTADGQICNSPLSYPERVKLADKNWKNRNKKAFAEIKAVLKKGCSGLERCSYCESNEATVVDHVAPKSKFPELTFDWENLLMACDQCNTHHKMDLFAVFDPVDSNTVIKLGKGPSKTEPPKTAFAFINPRKEDPLDFLYLNLKRGIFTRHPNKIKDRIAIAKAQNTLRILGMNRAALKGDRRNSVSIFMSQLDKYARIDAAQDFEELAHALKFPDSIDHSRPFNRVKARAKRVLKRRMLRSSHITVLHELRRQTHLIPDLVPYQAILEGILG